MRPTGRVVVEILQRGRVRAPLPPARPRNAGAEQGGDARGEVTDPQPKHELTAKYGRCPVCGMALWPDGTCTLPLHTAEKLKAESEAKAKVKGKVRRG